MRVANDILRIMIGRDRITRVLEPHLGPSSALERANNIAQALVLGSEDPVNIALEMLEKLELSNTPRLAAEVSQAWLSSIAKGHPR